MVSAIESTIDQTRQPGMKRTCVRSPDPFQITNIYGTMSLLAARCSLPPPHWDRFRQRGTASASSGRQSATQRPGNVVDGKCEEEPADHRAYLLIC
jgi:hypothetical protein